MDQTIGVMSVDDLCATVAELPVEHLVWFAHCGTRWAWEDHGRLEQSDVNRNRLAFAYLCLARLFSGPHAVMAGRGNNRESLIWI